MTLTYKNILSATTTTPRENKVKSLYCQPKICVSVNCKQSKSFYVVVGVRQGCVLSPLLFTTYIELDRQAQPNR